MTYLASRLAAVKPSASMAASMAAKALRAKGLDVIDLGLGEPDFPTPAHIAEAAHKAALDGQTLYTASAGTPALRAAVKAAGFLTRDPRVVERKKYGRAKARRSFQFSKR